MTALEPWVQKALLTAGHIDEQGNSRRARARHCPRCGLIVLVGYDADLCARLVTCDPTPLTTIGEAVAYLQGRYTRELAFRAGRLELDQRDANRITRWPATATGNRFDVLAEHRCSDRSLWAHRAPTWCPDNSTTAADQPPF